MHLRPYHIDPSSSVNDIIAYDYRTASVFNKYHIDYCCAMKLTVEEASSNAGLDVSDLVKELNKAMQQPVAPAKIEFEEWGLDFLSEYIQNVHHQYLRKKLPEILEDLLHVAEGHKTKYPELDELLLIFRRMTKEVPPHMQQEEEIIFPYIRQIYHAYKNHESYASLLVRTLRKPVEEVMFRDHEITTKRLQRIRQLTNNYTAPQNACIKHCVTFAKLKELDIDLVQHIHLENNILYPRAMAIEKELLISKE